MMTVQRRFAWAERDPVYQKVVRPVLEDHGFRCVRADELHKIGVIIDQVRERIRADALIARVLGTRDARHLLELAQRCEKLPDIRQLLKVAVPTVTAPARLNRAATPTS